jgi:LysR family hydrogen peroxide-inducible transcriptional activator
MSSFTLAGLSLRDLEYAVAVLQLRHFGRAAQRCGVSQSALSEQLRKLEGLLGVPLFERTNRRVEPTARGAPLLRQAERILAEAHGLLEMARAAGEPLAGEFRLGAIATIAPYYLPHLLRHLRAAFPRLDLLLTEGQTDRLLTALDGRELDAVLLALPAPMDRLTTEPLFFEPFDLVCPPGHRLASGDQPTLADLAGEELILLEEGHCLRAQALALCDAKAGSAGSRRRHATSVETLWHMIAAGEGYSLLPVLSGVGRTAMEGLVVRRALSGQEAGRTIGLAWRQTDPRASEFRQIAAFLRDNRPEAVLPCQQREKDEHAIGL